MPNKGFGRGPIPGRQRPETDAGKTGGGSGAAPRPQARLEIVNGPASGRGFELDRDKLLIGRNDPPAVMVDIDLTDAELGETPVISRRHAELSWTEDELYLRDLGSTNGTMYNGRDITRRSGQPHAEAQRLQDGDRLLLANIELLLRIAPVSG